MRFAYNSVIMSKLLTFLPILLTFFGPGHLFATDSHTYSYVEKGLAIETSGSMDVYNDTFILKKATLDELIAPAVNNPWFKKRIDNYMKDLSTMGIYDEQQRANNTLYSVHANIFTSDSVEWGSTITLTEALTPDQKDQKLVFDCDTSSFVYLKALETISKDIPVVLLDCPGHNLIRWKFSDGSYMDWETTSGQEPSKDKDKHYKEVCSEVIPGSNAFYAIFYRNSGNSKAAKKDNLAAITAYDKSLELNPNDASVYNNRGNAKSVLMDYIGSMADYEKAISINPSDLSYYSNLGTAKFFLSDYAGAIADYDKVLTPDSKMGQTYFNRGDAKYMLKDYKGAFDDYSSSIMIRPEDAGSYYNRALARAKLKDYDGAIDDYGKAIKLSHKQNVNAYINRAYMKDVLGDHKGAISDCKKALKLDPDNKSAQDGMDLFISHLQ